MLTAQDIKNITFSSAMGGYKKDEVDVFLDNVEADYEKIEKAIALKDAKISELEKQVAEFEQSKGSIQNVLISAQNLADQIVAEAKTKSAEIVAAAQKNVDAIADKGKQITTELDARALEKKSNLEQEIAEMIKKAEEKKAIIEQATAATVRKQQELYNAIRAEMNSFRNEITEKYKEHLQLLAKLPTTTELDPEKAATIVSEDPVDRSDISSKSDDMIKQESALEEMPEETAEATTEKEDE
ncbi:MAG: DivIVA domain-containing protein [Clostridia bacterium]|nr:DivIVA domain-containing protein [Clostridia bacterium]